MSGSRQPAGKTEINKGKIGSISHKLEENLQMFKAELSEEELADLETLLDMKVREMFKETKMDGFDSLEEFEFATEFADSLLTPWEIGDIVQEALSDLPEDIDGEQVSVIYDIVYNAVSLTAERLNS